MQDCDRQESQVQEIILRWQDLREEGADADLEALCADCRDLLPLVREGIDVLESMYRKMGIHEPSIQRAPASKGFSTTISQMEGAFDGPVRRDAPHIVGYEVMQKLGEGGMGVVYKAVHLPLNRVVALKMIRSGRHKAADQERFRQEAAALGRLHHPSIVQIFDFGLAEQRLYFSLEYLEGGSLADHLREHVLAAGQAAEIVQQLAEAVAYAHHRGIFHRDLKPGNILLTKAIPVAAPTAQASTLRGNTVTSPSAAPIPKIADFGLAKLVGGVELTQTGTVAGTPSYMSPEQASGKSRAAGPGMDIYSLGAILYELLTGRPPFKAATMMETLAQVQNSEPVAPRQLQPNVPRDLETICLKCLEKEPKKRFLSAATLAEDLQRFRRGEPIHARPTSTWERLGKWIRRKPALAGFVGFATLALMAFVTLYALYYSQLLAEGKAQETMRTETLAVLFEAQKHEAAGNWIKADTALQKIEMALKSHPYLYADYLGGEVSRLKELVQQNLQKQEQRQKAEKRLADFQTPYKDALFHMVQFTGLDRTDSQPQALAAIKKALAFYDLDVAASADTLWERERSHLTDSERRRLASACYELLLYWAEIEAQDPRNADKALALLTRAAKLGLKTKALHVRREHYRALSKGESFDRTEAEKTAPPPHDRLDWFLIAVEKYRIDKFQESIKACEQAVRLQNDDFWARYVKGLCLLRLGLWLDANAELTVCLNLRKDGFVWPRLLRGFASTQQGAKHLKASKDLALRAARTDRDAALVQKGLAENAFRAAQADLDAALVQDGDRLVQYVGLANRGVLFIHQELWIKAEVDLRRAIDANPKYFPAYVNLAQALLGRREMDEALKVMDQAVALAPQRASLYETRAKLHRAQKHRDKAIEDFKKAVALESAESETVSLADNLLELGKLLHEERNYGEALACFKRALEIRPQFVEAERFRAKTLLALGNFTEASQALDSFMRATKTATADDYYLRGLIEANLGRLRAAIEMYSVALQQAPGYTAARKDRGWAYLLNDAAVLALHDFEACLREKDDVDALLGRGNAHIRLKQLDAALKDALAAEKHDGLTKNLHWYKLARIHAQAVSHLLDKGRHSRFGLDKQDTYRLAFCKEKAFMALRQTMEATPRDQQAKFWRTHIEIDPAFLAIQSEHLYTYLRDRYGAK